MRAEPSAVTIATEATLGGVAISPSGTKVTLGEAVSWPLAVRAAALSVMSNTRLGPDFGSCSWPTRLNEPNVPT